MALRMKRTKVMQLAAMQGYVTRKQVEDALQVKQLRPICFAGAV